MNQNFNDKKEEVKIGAIVPEGMHLRNDSEIDFKKGIVTERMYLKRDSTPDKTEGIVPQKLPQKPIKPQKQKKES